MNLHIAGVNRWNKGAELMLVAVLERFRERHPSVRFSIEKAFGGKSDRAHYDLGVLFDGSFKSRRYVAMRYLPTFLLSRNGYVKIDRVSAVLDASGFAFGDQHPPERVERFAARVAEWQRKGIRVVLLPQALGPFEDPRIGSAFKQVVDSGTLIFARDQASYEYATALAAHEHRVKVAPDFTCLVKPSRKDLGSSMQGKVLFVPNDRMIEKAESDTDARNYVRLMATLMAEVRRRGHDIVIMIHGDDDEGVARELSERFDRRIPVVRENDPIAIKAHIGTSFLLVGSRYHALISGLSQGVPCIATSWSHKYETLFTEYGCDNMILNVDAGESEVSAALDRATGDRRESLVSNIESNAKAVRDKTEAMWHEVDVELGLVGTSIDAGKHTVPEVR